MSQMTGRILRASETSETPGKTLKKGKERFSLGQSCLGANPKEAETQCRKALELLRDAFLLTKDFRITRLLHRYGRIVHNTFRCPIPFEEGGYLQSCPVFLSHIRHGFSPGIIGTEVCSVCGGNMLECDHVKGWVYGNVPARTIRGVCNICRKKKCTHKEGQRYNHVAAFAFLENVHADHIALVENPKDPWAAIMARELDKDEILKQLSEKEQQSFVHGKSPLFCHHCMICIGCGDDA